MNGFRVLGPVEAWTEGGRLPLGGRQQVALLAFLLLNANRAVSADWVIDAIWGAEREGARHRLQMSVSRLRRALEPLSHDGASCLRTVSGGYLLAVDLNQLDAAVFAQRIGDGRRALEGSDPVRASDLLAEALELWRGPPLAEVAFEDFAQTEIRRLEELRLGAFETRIDADLRLGRHRDLIAELEALLCEEPTRERLAGQLMTALYRSDRQADALEVYQHTRAHLASDLGIEPGPALNALQAQVLEHDSRLEFRVSDARVTSTGSDPHAAAFEQLRSMLHDPAVELVTLTGTGGVGKTSLAPEPARGWASPRPIKLPLPPTRFLGRARELADVTAVLRSEGTRLLTLTGAGGSGKTRLALRAAESNIAAYSDGVWFIGFADITDPDLIAATICQTLGLNEPRNCAPLERLKLGLADRELLLVLDNLEQLAEGSGVLGELLADCSYLTLLVTSRVPLHLASERQYEVPVLADVDAVALFTARAQAIESRRAVDPEFAALICQRLDCLPLAIELAAARTKALSLSEILARLDTRLPMLTGGPRDAPRRQHTLRATLEWSYQLLNPREQRLFAHLAVFHGGWTLEACEAVAERTAVEGLAALVDHNLVMRDRSRFRMLETVREYAAERFAVMVDHGEIQRRHANWCVELAEAAERKLEGSDQAAWFERLDDERENLRAASIWAAQHNEPEISLRLDGALCLFWLTRGAATEILGTLTPALQSGKGAPSTRAKALNSAAILSGTTGDLRSARTSVEAALDLATELRDSRQIARALTGLGVLASFAGDYATALARASEAAEISREAGYVRGEHNAYHNMAVAHALMGQIDPAISLATRSVELARTTGDRLELAERILLLARLMVYHRPQDPQLRLLLGEGFALTLSTGARARMIECLELTAAVCSETGEPALGAALLGAAEAERKRAHTGRPPDESRDYETTVHHLRRALGLDGYSQEREQGRSWSLDEAVTEALKIIEREETPPSIAATIVSASGTASPGAVIPIHAGARNRASG